VAGFTRLPLERPLHVTAKKLACSVDDMLKSALAWCSRDQCVQKAWLLMFAQHDKQAETAGHEERHNAFFAACIDCKRGKGAVEQR
jgi:hypothetical protein